jgi:hypothetical protein
MRKENKMAMKLKALGLALAAAFALSAAAASTASADEVHSGSASGFTYATVDQYVANILDTPSGNIKCSVTKGHIKYTGTTATEATVTGLAFSSCTAFGLTAHIDTMGCTYTLTGSTSNTGFVDIVCPTTAGGVTHSITITPTQGGNAICHINVPEQRVAVNILNGPTTAAQPPIQPHIPDDIAVEPELTDTITYTSERTLTLICPTDGHHEDGVYTGSFTVTGFEDAAHTVRTGLTYT